MKTLYDFLHEQLCYIYQEIDENEGGLYKGQLELASFLIDECETCMHYNLSKYDIVLNFTKK